MPDVVVCTMVGTAHIEFLGSVENIAKAKEEIYLHSKNQTKRIFNLDTNAYSAGALDVKTKELLGLVASAVLRCDDCIKYHLETSYKEGITREEMMEVMGIATLVGGTIVIPHLRRAYEFWEALEETGK